MADIRPDRLTICQSERKSVVSRPTGGGAGFLRVLRFSLPVFIPPISPQSPPPIIIRVCYNRPVVAAVPKVPPHKLKKKNSRRPSVYPSPELREQTTGTAWLQREIVSR
jgi:hypothetical protein